MSLGEEGFGNPLPIGVWESEMSANVRFCPPYIRGGDMPFRRIVAPFDWPHEYAHALLPGLPEEFCEEAARKAKAVSDN